MHISQINNEMEVDPHISAHDRSSFKRDNLPSLFASITLRFDWHITQSYEILWDLDLKVKLGLQVWLVKAWKGSSGITSLKLGAHHVVVSVQFWSS